MKRNIRLGAIEELASMSMLCSDKTGTLTTGKMTMDLPKSMGQLELLQLAESKLQLELRLE